MPASFEVGRHPNEGLKNPTVVRDRATPDVFPIRPTGVKEAIRRSMGLWLFRPESLPLVVLTVQLLLPEVYGVPAGGDVLLVEAGRSRRLLGVLGPRQLGPGLLVVFATALMVGVAPRTGPVHLEELAGHVRTGE